MRVLVLAPVASLALFWFGCAPAPTTGGASTTSPAFRVADRAPNRLVAECDTEMPPGGLGSAVMLAFLSCNAAQATLDRGFRFFRLENYRFVPDVKRARGAVEIEILTPPSAETRRDAVNAAEFARECPRPPAGRR